MPDWSWRKEFEMDPHAASGKPVFPELRQWEDRIFVPLRRVVKDGIIPDWWPRYAGFDWGRNNPTAFELATITPDGTLIFYWEYYQRDSKPHQTDAICKAHPDWEKITYVVHDPSMESMTAFGGGVRREDQEKSLSEIFSQLGWNLIPGRRGDDNAFATSLYRAWESLDNPKIIVTQSCPNLWNELVHLRFDELNTSQIMKRNTPEKIVDKDNHAFDAVKYLVMSHPPGPERKDIWENLTKEERVKSTYKPPQEPAYDEIYGEI